MDWATVGNFSAPATLKIPHVIQDVHNKKKKTSQTWRKCKLSQQYHENHHNLSEHAKRKHPKQPRWPDLRAFDMHVMGYLRGFARHGVSLRALTCEILSDGCDLATMWQQMRRGDARCNAVVWSEGTRCTGLQRAVLTGPQPQCIGLPAAEARQFFCYCLGLRGGRSSHFAPICTTKLRRDQSSRGGGRDKCTECHINHGHQGLFSLLLFLTRTHMNAQPPSISKYFIVHKTGFLCRVQKMHSKQQKRHLTTLLKDSYICIY